MTESILTLKALSGRAPDTSRESIRDMNLEILPGETVAILGMRRWERKILIDLISGLERPESGEILFQGTAVHASRDEELNALRGRMGIVTDPPVFLNNVRIRENLRLPLRYHSKLSRSAIDEKIDDLAKEMNMGAFPDVIPSSFEHHFLGAAALVRALSVAPDLLIVERPSECLGKDRALRLPGLWSRHVLKHGGAALVLTTLPRLALSLCEKIVVFENGTVQSIQTVDSFRKSKKSLETQWKEPDHDDKG